MRNRILSYVFLARIRKDYKIVVERTERERNWGDFLSVLFNVTPERGNRQIRRETRWKKLKGITKGERKKYFLKSDAF